MRPRRRFEAFSPEVKFESTASVLLHVEARDSGGTRCVVSALSYAL